MKDIPRLLIALGAPLAVGVAASLATDRGVAAWYPALAKPAFTPPPWVFGPVWTVLYLAMGVAAYLVWRRGPASREVRIALALWWAQLALNGLWSVVFFALHRPGWALVEIGVLWAAVALTARSFRSIEPLAGWLLVPYLAWVAFAAALNAGIWWLNR